MLSIETISLFFSASLLLALIPGPDNIYLLSLSVSSGKQTGILFTLGLCTGLLVHTAAAVFGLSSLIQSSDSALLVLKSLGALYLLYLAWQLLKAEQNYDAKQKVEPIKKLVAYRRGVLMNLTNPKVLMFFLAFLPQFIDPEWGSVTAQLLQFSALFILSTLVIFGGISVLAESVSSGMSLSRRWVKLLNWATAGLFSALAFLLIFELI